MVNVNCTLHISLQTYLCKTSSCVAAIADQIPHTAYLAQELTSNSHYQTIYQFLQSISIAMFV